MFLVEIYRKFNYNTILVYEIMRTQIFRWKSQTDTFMVVPIWRAFPVPGWTQNLIIEIEFDNSASSPEKFWKGKFS